MVKQSDVVNYQPSVVPMPSPYGGFTSKPSAARQGDVMLRPSYIGGLTDKGLKRIVLAEGEKTGHSHVLEAIGDTELELVTVGGTLFVRVVGQAGGRVVHEEHATVTVPAGDYEVRRQREYDPDASPRERAVTD